MQPLPILHFCLWLGVPRALWILRSIYLVDLSVLDIWDAILDKVFLAFVRILRMQSLFGTIYALLGTSLGVLARSSSNDVSRNPLGNGRASRLKFGLCGRTSCHSRCNNAWLKWEIVC